MAVNSKFGVTKQRSLKYRISRFFRRSINLCIGCCRDKNGVDLTQHELNFEKYSPMNKIADVNERKNYQRLERESFSTQIVKEKLKEKTYSLSRESLYNTEMLNHELPLLIDVLTLKINIMRAELAEIEDMIHHKSIFHRRSRYSVVDIEEVHCPLCTAFFSEPVVINCGHIFCEWCISEHVLETKTKKCPVCKEDITLMNTSTMMIELIESAMAGASPQTMQEYKLMECSRAFLREQVMYLDYH